jgi:hypothetical protein
MRNVAVAAAAVRPAVAVAVAEAAAVRPAVAAAAASGRAGAVVVQP